MPNRPHRPANANASQPSSAAQPLPPSLQPTITNHSSYSSSSSSSFNTTPPKKEPVPEFKITFQFVGSQDAKKATTENRSHVMREFRRKQRWEQEQKKRLKSESEEGGLASGEGGKFTLQFHQEEPAKKKGARGGKGKGKGAKRKAEDGDEQGRDMGTGEDEFDIRKDTNSIQTLTRFSGPQLYAPSLETPVLDVFTDRFVDAFAPRDSYAECGAATSIRSAATIRMFSPLLQSAFNAVSTTFVGQQVDDGQIVSAGHGIYVSVLKSLRTALAHPIYSKSEAVLATVVLLIAYESMQHTTPEALTKHCIGALQLIEHRGPYSHVDGVEHLCFTELRPYWAYAALVIRTPTFLSDEVWKTVPWSDPRSNKDIMQHLLDHIVDIPTGLAAADAYNLAAQSAAASPAELTLQQQALWALITKLESQMRGWKRDHADAYPLGQPHPATNTTGHSTFPPFVVTNPLTGSSSTPPLILYPDPQLCRTLCTYYAAMIVLKSIDTRPPEMNPISPLEAFGFAVTICRSVEYFISNVPGNMTNRMAFPLRAAHEALPPGGGERRFIGEVNGLVQSRRVSKVFLAITESEEG